jgi:hypothetical protein
MPPPRSRRSVRDNDIANLTIVDVEGGLVIN